MVAAFDSLKAEGYVNATVGSGTYVACELPENLLVVPRSRVAKARRHGARGPAPALEARAAASPLFAYATGPAPAFRLGQPALDLFPTTLWAQVASRRLRMATAKQLLGCDAMGYEPLREAMADYLVTSRGVNCAPDQVAIVSGTLEALNIAARLLVDPGDRVGGREPGLLRHAGRVSTPMGAKLVPVPVDDEGLVVDAKRMKGARLVYVTPAHQYPHGREHERLAPTRPARLGAAARARRSSRTTTTASTGTVAGRCPRCRASTAAAT